MKAVIEVRPSKEAIAAYRWLAHWREKKFLKQFMQFCLMKQLLKVQEEAAFGMKYASEAEAETDAPQDKGNCCGTCDPLAETE